VPSLDNGGAEDEASATAAADDVTTASEQIRKKEKLQKIMDYRKKALPLLTKNMDQKTLDGWLQVGKNKKDEGENNEKEKTMYETIVERVASKEEKGRRSGSNLTSNVSSFKKGSGGEAEGKKEKRVASRGSLMGLLEEDNNKESVKQQSGSSQQAQPMSNATRLMDLLEEENNKQSVKHQSMSAVAEAKSSRSIKMETKSRGGAVVSPEDSKSITSETKSRGKFTDFLFEESVKMEVEPKKKEKKPARTIPIVKSESSGRPGTHPVKLVKFDPNADDDGTLGDGVSLPPEIKCGKKIKIWDEDESFVVSKEGDVYTPRTRQLGRVFGDSCFTCGDADEATIDDNDDTFLDKTVGGGTYKRSASSSVFACGTINPAELRKDIVTEVKGARRDIKSGIRSSIRNLFGVCDIAQDGGVDILKDNMTNTIDQLFGRKSVPKSAATNYAPRRAKDNTNPQAERMTSILQGNTSPRGRKTTLPSNEKQKKKPSLTEEQKKKLYLEKLKEVSLKHL